MPHVTWAPRDKAARGGGDLVQVDDSGEDEPAVWPRALGPRVAIDVIPWLGGRLPVRVQPMWTEHVNRIERCQQRRLASLLATGDVIVDGRRVRRPRAPKAPVEVCINALYGAMVALRSRASWNDEKSHPRIWPQSDRLSAIVLILSLQCHVSGSSRTHPRLAIASSQKTVSAASHSAGEA